MNSRHFKSKDVSVPTDLENERDIFSARDWKESGVEPSSECIPYRLRSSNELEVQRAEERRLVFDQVILGLPVKRGMELLGLKKSRFYKLLDEYRAGRDLVRKARGTPKGSCRLTAGQLAALKKAYEQHYVTPKASISKLLTWAQQYCLATGEKPISRYAARTFLYRIPERERDRKIYTKEVYEQKYGFKPKKLPVDGLLHRVSMDHTLVDIILVDEFNRDVTIGRPWITVLICDKSRVILGFYLSLEPPNLNTVAAALAFAVLEKSKSLFDFIKNPEEYPFFGIPYVIFTDNAAEFTSESFIRQCKEWGMSWEHRPKGKKWYGGIIERVIGTFMTSEVHFLPGSTGSNVLERQGFKSELDATMDFNQFAEWMLAQVTIYHGKIHASLRCTPRQAYESFKRQGKYDPSRVIEKEDEITFLIDFCPTSYAHKVHPYGVNFAGRRYASNDLAGLVGQTLDIKYLQYNLSYIWLKAPGGFIKVPCSFTREELSNHWESYSDHRQKSKRSACLINKPSGTVDDEFAPSALARQEEILQAAIDMKTSFMTARKNSRLTQSVDNSDGRGELMGEELYLMDDSKESIISAGKNLSEDEDIFIPRIIVDSHEAHLLTPVLIVDKNEE